MLIREAGGGEYIRRPARRFLLASLALLHFWLRKDGAMEPIVVDGK